MNYEPDHEYDPYCDCEDCVAYGWADYYHSIGGKENMDNFNDE